ncbi:RNA polymerase sigma factor [Streptococcus moroccensis]|uniref:RNA polymerase sigma-70 factor (ECF subfamily) n=1 Tax=Streptococcus moroccensis TaxID=1451356 RepID=A0ABT9YRZ7_9STRE|nr:RNA polymerase sigma factor [Streptococcus moroccensis]MDQ0222540.1 RNA polymerase sigma-70 factor (ECF subfamily) [Streptococcus moroccensis]
MAIQLDDYEKELIAWAREIIAYLVMSGVSPADAQDVTQDVFVRLLESEFVLPASKLRSWMYRTAIRRYIDLYRRDKTYRDILQKEFFTKDSLVYYDDVDGEFILEMVKKLNQDQRISVELYYFQGFSVKEIAHIRGASQSKVKIDLMRGRQTLKHLLEKEGYQDGNI